MEMKFTIRENDEPIPIKEELWEPSAHSINYARKGRPSWQAEPSLFDDRAVLENKEKHKMKKEQAPGSCNGSGSANVFIDVKAEYTSLQED